MTSFDGACTLRAGQSNQTENKTQLKVFNGNVNVQHNTVRYCEQCGHLYGNLFIVCYRFKCFVCVLARRMICECVARDETIYVVFCLTEAAMQSVHQSRI